MYGLGARKRGVTSFPPLGCLPAARTLFGHHENRCVSRINNGAQSFNKKINSAASDLQKRLPCLRILVFDNYKPLRELVNCPSKFCTHHNSLQFIYIKSNIFTTWYNLNKLIWKKVTLARIYGPTDNTLLVHRAIPQKYVKFENFPLFFLRKFIYFLKNVKIFL